MSVLEYEKEKAWKFEEGMVYYVKSRITPVMITDYAEAHKRALIIEDSFDRSASER